MTANNHQKNAFPAYFFALIWVVALFTFFGRQLLGWGLFKLYEWLIQSGIFG